MRTDLCALCEACTPVWLHWGAVSPLFALIQTAQDRPDCLDNLPLLNVMGKNWPAARSTVAWLLRME